MNKRDIKQNLQQMLPYLLGFAALFYIAPAISMLDMQAAESGLLFYMLFIFNPALTFVLNIMYATRHGFVWYFPLLAGVLFAPSILLFYNQTAIPYIFSYIVLGYIGAAAGCSIRKNRNHTNY